MHHLNPFRRTHGSSQEPPPYSPPATSSSTSDEKRSDEKHDLKHDPGHDATYSAYDEQGSSSAYNSDPPPYHAWMEVPDNSLLPPPPSLGFETSPTANASDESAEAAIAWCHRYPLYQPRALTPAETSSVNSGDVGLIKVPATPASITSSRPGTYRIQSRPNCPDSSIVTALPLFSSYTHNYAWSNATTIYFEIRINRMGGSSYGSGSSSEEAEAGIALGYAAPPYPPFRLPGWERASLGVHGDDGRRYVNNNAGGKDFTTAFADGEVIGLGMKFSASRGKGPSRVEIFLTRNGERAGGWDLDEERDADSVLEGPIAGLQGESDLMGAVGFFGSVDFECRFRRDEWLYRP